MTVTDTHTDLARRIASAGAAGRFPTYYEAPLREAAERARATADAHAPDPDAAESVLAGALAALQARLDVLGVRTLVASYRAERAEDPSVTYAAFDAHLAAPALRAELHASYPELARLEALTIERWHRDLDTVLTAAHEARAELEALGATGGVVDLAAGLGDGHCGGRSVALLTFASGARLAVKPNPGGALPVVREMLRRLDPDGDVFGPALPVALVAAGHEWQEVVEPSPVRGVTERRRWARRAGRVSALAFAVGATDLHRENVVATREGPVVIDTETLTSLPSGDEATDDVAVALRRDLETSPLRTMLHPARYLGSPIDLDLCAYGGATQVGQAASTLPVLRVVDEGTNEIRFETRPTGQRPESNVLRDADGCDVDLREHVRDLVDGYREGMALVRRHPDLMRSVLADVRPGPVRQVLRPTWVYDVYLRASTHPVRMTSREERLRSVELLVPRHAGIPPELGPHARRHEVDALMDLDVPYFTVEDGGLLRADGVRPVPGAVQAGPDESLLWWWDTARDRDVEADARLLAIAWDTASDDAYDAPPARREPARVDAGSAHPVRSADGTRATWLTGVTLGHGVRLAPIPLSFAEGGGTLVEAARRDPDGLRDPRGLVASAVAGATWHPVPTDPDAPETVLSPFVGAPADAVTLLELADAGLPLDAEARARVRATFADLAGTLATRLDRWEPGDPADYLGGIAGALHALAVHDVGAGLEQLADVARRGRHWPEFVRAQEAGLAHGTYGRLLGLASLAALTGAESVHEAVDLGVARVPVAHAGHRLGRRDALEAAAAAVAEIDTAVAAGTARSGLGRAPCAEGFLMGSPGRRLAASALHRPDVTPLILGGMR